MTRSETIGALGKALAAAQGEMKGAAKESLNPHFKHRYADLSSVWDACREPLARNGLSVVQTLDSEGAALVVETLLIHASGEFIGGRMAITPARSDAQGYGAICSYMRRYSLSALIGGYAEDNDAETDRAAAAAREVAAKMPPATPEAEVRALVKAAIERCGQEPVMAALAERGWKTAKDVPADKIPELRELLEGLKNGK